MNNPNPMAYAGMPEATIYTQSHLDLAIAAERRACTDMERKRAANLCRTLIEGRVATHYDWCLSVGEVLARKIESTAA